MPEARPPQETRNIDISSLKNRLFLAMLAVAIVPLILFALFYAKPRMGNPSPILEALFLFSLCLAFIAIVALFLSKWLSRPIIALKETHHQLVQSAKLASVGTLAAGIAHELNQSLMVIRGYTQMLLEDLEPGSGPYEEMKAIEQQTSRMTRIIRQINDFSRQSKGEYERVDPHILLDNTILLLQQQLKHDEVQVEKHYEPYIPMIRADINQLEQVFLNLIINACDAMADKSGAKRIRLKTACTRPDPGSDTYITIEFSDCGEGMSDTVQARIFDPFFTTKRAGKGTGLGLSISYGLIKEHGGWIEVESQEGIGSTFRIVLPAADN